MFRTLKFVFIFIFIFIFIFKTKIRIRNGIVVSPLNRTFRFALFDRRRRSGSGEPSNVKVEFRAGYLFAIRDADRFQNREIRSDRRRGPD